MKNATIMIIMTIALLCGVRANAQNKYDLKEYDEVGRLGKNCKGSISDFVSWMLAEPEDEVHGPMSDAWKRYLQKKPLDEGTTILLDTKNGYFRYEVEFVDEYENEGTTEIYRSTLFVEMCVWNSADGKFKVFGENVGGTFDGKPHDSGQYDGTCFYLFDKVTHKLYSFYDAIDTEERCGLVPSQNWEYDGQQWFYANDHITGERKQMTSEEFDQWMEDRPVVVLSLPRTGKNIKVNIYAVTGDKEKEFVWDGYRFHLAK
jgi:hypothetical protein